MSHPGLGIFHTHVLGGSFLYCVGVAMQVSISFTLTVEEAATE